MKQEEHYLQCECVRLFRTIPKYKGLILFSIPNGGHRSILTAVKMKLEGQLSGIPDLFLAKPCGKYHGLFIEMKSKKGRLSDKQEEMRLRLLEAGYEVAICRSVHDFYIEIDNYLMRI